MRYILILILILFTGCALTDTSTNVGDPGYYMGFYGNYYNNYSPDLFDEIYPKWYSSDYFTPVIIVRPRVKRFVHSTRTYNNTRNTNERVRKKSGNRVVRTNSYHASSSNASSRSNNRNNTSRNKRRTSNR